MDSGRPVRKHANDFRGETTLQQTIAHATPDGYDTIMPAQGPSRKGSAKVRKPAGLRQNLKLLGDLGVEILGPMNEAATFSPFQQWPQKQEQRGVRHSDNHVTGRQPPGAPQQSWIKREITERAAPVTGASERKRTDPFQANSVYDLRGRRSFASAGSDNGDFTTLPGQLLCQVRKQVPGGSIGRRINPIYEKNIH
jgi:hypothetical protein